MMVSGSTATWLQYPWLIPQIHGKAVDGGGVGAVSGPYVSRNCSPEGILAGESNNWGTMPVSSQLPAGAPEATSETTVPLRRRVRGRFCYGDHEGGAPSLDRVAAAEIEAEEELRALGNDCRKWNLNGNLSIATSSVHSDRSSSSLVGDNNGGRKRRREEEEAVRLGQIGGGGGGDPYTVSDPFIGSDPVDGQLQEGGIDTIAASAVAPEASSKSVDISSSPGGGAIIPVLSAAASPASRYSLAAGWSERVYPNLVTVEHLRAFCQEQRARREAETLAGNLSSSQSLVLSSNNTFGALTASGQSIILLPDAATSVLSSNNGGVRIEEVVDDEEEEGGLHGELNGRTSVIAERNPLGSSVIAERNPLGNELQEGVGEPIDMDGEVAPPGNVFFANSGHQVQQSGSAVIPPTTCTTTFGVVFPGKSSVLDATRFVQMDQAHWVLDLNSFVGPAYEQITEMCIFLPNETLLPADAALAVYVQAPGSSWEYRGAVSNAHPSAVVPLSWPQPAALVPQVPALGLPLSGQIGISVEPLSSLPSVDAGNQKKEEDFARKVAENLFNFMQSFCKKSQGKVVVSTDVLDRWFTKFQEKSRCDPEYILRMAAGV